MRWLRSYCFAVIATALLPVLGGCARESEPSGPKYGTGPANRAVAREYSFAIHPLHNPAKLDRTYRPLLDYLGTRLEGATLTLEASRDYAAFEEKYRERKPAFVLPNPWQTLQAMAAGYHVIAMAGEPADFRGIFVVRRDGGLRVPTDLKGKAVSYPSPTALAACIMPQRFLHERGIDVRTDIENRYVGSQESSIMNVYLGLTAAGATWPPPWRAFQKEHPAEAAELTVLWETEPLINNSVMARDDVPPELVERVRSLLVGLPDSAEGAALLATMETSRFLPANDADYEVVRRYIADFEREIRPVEKR
ncbi:MAG TPA: phosphate/phosphite/phosphonate ABC transporter substrate-binding protein [Opitutaceae bacterium]|nr:phosphate/phosphite/phosphonate ABC transporter substrate-binding protein [Opitutaceae bacterium]